MQWCWCRTESRLWASLVYSLFTQSNNESRKKVPRCTDDPWSVQITTDLCRRGCLPAPFSFLPLPVSFKSIVLSHLTRFVHQTRILLSRCWTVCPKVCLDIWRSRRVWAELPSNFFFLALHVKVKKMLRDLVYVCWRTPQSCRQTT